MFAMRDEEAFMMFVVMASSVGIVAMLLRHKHRTERLRTIQKAIDAGNIDETTRRSILEALATDARNAQAMWRSSAQAVVRGARNLMFLVGWLTFTIGGVVLLGMLLFGASRYDVQGATIATAIGFGLVSLPMALRELESRRSVRG